MSQPVHVLATLRFSETQLHKLRSISPRLIIRQQSIREDRDDISGFLEGHEEVVYCFTPPRDLARAPRLKWVQLHSAGIDHLRGHPIWESDIPVTTMSGIHAVPIGEFVFALLSSLARRIPRIVRLQERAEWPRQKWELLGGTELRGKTIGIIGYGSIGREVARIARHGYHMRVLALRHGTDAPRLRYNEAGVGDPEGRIPERWFTPDQLGELLSTSDVVVVSAPSTTESRGMLGEAQLRGIKPGAFLINIARGDLIDERALVQALKENWIGGAGLDVYSVEPLPRASQLWHMDNVIVAPHIAGATPLYDDRAVQVFAENLRRYLTGMPLLNLVSREQGY